MKKWTDIPGWEGRYQASESGKIRSLDMKCQGPYNCTTVRKGRELVLVVKGGRYMCVTLAKGVQRKQYLVHDLVALTFLGPKPEGLEVRHLNDDKTNNSKRNLVYGTRAENELDRQRNGRVRKGEDHGMVKLTETDVKYIRSCEDGPSALAAEFGITAAHVHSIRTRRSWKHL
jgi:hypothetical protein